MGPAWKSSLEDTAEVAEALMPSGRVLWGLDETQEIFSAYGIGGQPIGAMVAAGGSLLSTWSGAGGAGQIREVLDTLLANT